MNTLILVGEFQAETQEAELQFVPDGKTIPLAVPPKGMSEGLDPVGWSALLSTAMMGEEQEVTVSILDVRGGLWIIAPFALFGHFADCCKRIDEAVGVQGPLALIVGLSSELPPEQSASFEEGIFKVARATVGPRPLFQILSATIAGNSLLFHALGEDDSLPREGEGRH